MRRRLFLQIYASFVSVSLFTLAMGIVAFQVSIRQTFSVPEPIRVATEVLLKTLPDPQNAPAEYREEVVRIAGLMDISVSIWSATGRLLAQVGERRRPPPEGCPSTWIRSSQGALGLCFQIPDGHWVAFTGGNAATRSWALRGLAMMLAIVLSIAIGCYPLARRITRRLETLQSSVEAFGGGDLTCRVAVEGQDEVARLAESFNATADRISTLVDQQRRVLAHASHELRSPLARLQLQIALLKETDDQKGRAQLSAEAVEEITLLDDLIEDVLLASRLRGGVTTARTLQPIDVASLCAAAAEAEGAALCIPSGGPWIATADARLLRRALTNLLRNAKRHGVPPISIRLAATPTDLSVAVLDRGPGVPEADRDRIFEPFYRPAGHAEGDEGVGLGLSLVAEIAAHLGGSVSYASRADGGACFTLSLPRVQQVMTDPLEPGGTGSKQQ